VGFPIQKEERNGAFKPDEWQSGRVFPASDSQQGDNAQDYECDDRDGVFANGGTVPGRYRHYAGILVSSLS